MAYLHIDTLLSRVLLFNHASDYNSALEDLALVVQLCEQYPEKNESTLNSAIFQMGRNHMELRNFEGASDSFLKCQDMLKQQLKTLSMVAS